MKKHRRALKPKNVERQHELALKHPADLTEAERKELEKLNKLQQKYG